MKLKVFIINLASLLAIASFSAGLILAIAAFQGTVELAQFRTLLGIISLAWFVSAPLWFVPSLFGEEFAKAGDQAWLRPRKEES